MKTTVGIAGHKMSQVCRNKKFHVSLVLLILKASFPAEAEVSGNCIPSQSISLSLPNPQHFQQ